MSDYFALVTNSYGGGSWARGKDKADTAKRAARIYKSDWKHLFKIANPIKVNVMDVEGFDEIWWDNRGVWCGNQRIDRSFELIEVKVK